MNHIKILALLILAVASLQGQDIRRWSMTTGKVTLAAAATAATVQQPATNSIPVQLESAIVYCSVACEVSQSRDGTAATATAGTVRVIAPTPANATAPFNFFTASNVGAGTAQGGVIHVPAGGTVNICLSTLAPGCAATGPVSASPVTLVSGGTATNYTISVAAITGDVNITFYARTAQ